MVLRVKENCRHPNKLKKGKEIKLQHVTWESPRKNSAKKAHEKDQGEAPHHYDIQSSKEHFQWGPKLSESEQGSAQRLSFFLVALVKDQLLFPRGHMNLPYFALLNFFLLTALVKPATNPSQ
jgi:hypothetical protein